MDPYRLSGAARRAIEAAEKAARALGHDRLETGHLVLALLGEKGAASVALGRAGVTEAALRKAVDEVYEGARGGRARDLDRSAGEVREALELARDEADAAGEHDIPPVRLFLAATEEDEGSAYRALGRLGVDVERLRAAAEALARDEAQGSLPDA